MSETTAEFRAQEIKTRRIEIAATLAEWKRAFFVDGIERPFTDRVTLEAEYATLSLEARLIGDAANKAKVERDSLRAVNAELLEALGSIEEYWNQDQNESAMADACWHAIETARAAIASARKQGEQG